MKRQSPTNASTRASWAEKPLHSGESATLEALESTLASFLLASGGEAEVVEGVWAGGVEMRLWVYREMCPDAIEEAETPAAPRRVLRRGVEEETRREKPSSCGRVGGGRGGGEMEGGQGRRKDGGSRRVCDRNTLTHLREPDPDAVAGARDRELYRKGAEPAQYGPGPLGGAP